MAKPTLYSEAYRIAEGVHTGWSERTTKDECGRAASHLGVSWWRLYQLVKSIFMSEFAREAAA